MTTNDKINAFEYFLMGIFDWYREDVDTSRNDLSKLKIFKLHFFTSSVCADDSNDGLLKVFNNFHALPYGPVESDIYNNLGQLSHFEVDSSSLSMKVSKLTLQDLKLDEDIIKKIDESLSRLKSINRNIINYSAFELVELSHRWRCWKMTYQLAKRFNKSSSQIPEDLIKAEIKQFIF